jgi:hypothetical protein
MKHEQKRRLNSMEQRIVDIIYHRGLASVEQVHQLMPEVDFVQTMRKVHRLCHDGYLVQAHFGGVAYYELPFNTMATSKSTIIRSLISGIEKSDVTRN